MKSSDTTSSLLKTTVCFTKIVTNSTELNVIPTKCEAWANVRFLGDQKNALKAI